MDFFTVTTPGLRVLYVFLVLDHARRKVLHFAITPNPTMEWVIQQLREASLQKKGLLTARTLWREMRREHHASMRLLGLGWRLLSQDKAERADARRRWESGELPGDRQAELLHRLTRFAPDHAWDPEKTRSVRSGCGLTPETLLQVLREKQTNAGGPPHA